MPGSHLSHHEGMKDRTLMEEKRERVFGNNKTEEKLFFIITIDDHVREIEKQGGERKLCMMLQGYTWLQVCSSITMYDYVKSIGTDFLPMLVKCTSHKTWIPSSCGSGGNQTHDLRWRQRCLKVPNDARLKIY